MTELLKGILIAAIPCGILIGYLLMELDQMKFERDHHKRGEEALVEKYIALIKEYQEATYEPEHPCKMCYRGWARYTDDTVEKCSDTCPKLKDYIESLRKE